MLTAYPVPGKEKSARLCEAFIAGAPRDAEGAVFFGVNETNAREWRKAKASGLPWFYGDNAFFDATRGKRFRWAKNRVQIDAQPLQSDGTRFDALGLKLRPPSLEGKHWLFVEQSPSFMQCVAGDPMWLPSAMAELGVPSRLRSWRRDKKFAAASLSDDLRGCQMLVTHSSAAAVQAMLAGIPITVSSISALAGCVTSDYWTNRERVLGVLADHEFNLQELKDGAAWRRLHP